MLNLFYFSQCCHFSWTMDNMVLIMRSAGFYPLSSEEHIAI
jgi:hypothetical protein